VQSEVESQTNTSIRLILIGAHEAHILAHEIAARNVSVVLTPSRQFPLTWDEQRVLPGPPLTAESGLEVLLRAGVTVGLGVSGMIGGWPARSGRFDISWVC